MSRHFYYHMFLSFLHASTKRDTKARGLIIVCVQYLKKYQSAYLHKRMKDVSVCTSTTDLSDILRIPRLLQKKGVILIRKAGMN